MLHVDLVLKKVRDKSNFALLHCKKSVKYRYFVTFLNGQFYMLVINRFNYEKNT